MWHWIRALYREPLPLRCRRAIVLPCQRARRSRSGGIELVPMREQQHRLFVELLKVLITGWTMEAPRTSCGPIFMAALIRRGSVIWIAEEERAAKLDWGAEPYWLPARSSTLVDVER